VDDPVNVWSRLARWWDARRARTAARRAYIESYENPDDYVRMRNLKAETVREWQRWRDALTDRDPSSRRQRSRLAGWRARWMSDAEVRRLDRDEHRVPVSFDPRFAVPHYPNPTVVMGPSGPILMPDPDA